MGTVVLKLTKEKQDTVISDFGRHQVSPPPYARFAARTTGCILTVYNSGKVMFQGQEAETVAARYGSPVTKKAASTASGSLPEGFANWSVVGSDEVGKGDFFGPLVVVAAYVDSTKIKLVRELGVRDSKNVSDPEIRTIARDLHAVIPYEYRILHNPDYNQMQRTMTQGKMTALLHNAALNGLLAQLEEPPQAILIDQFAEKATYYKHLSGETKQVKDNVYFSTKAEGLHVAVAAASILARAIFLKEMDKLSRQTGIEIPKGAGAKVDQVAASLLLKYGPERLHEWTKYHFANTKKAEALAEKRNRP
ncbi:ribonuclease HIII [Exiguobacterium sp. RIT594]|uniref:ribonuclease HIII n=1 Tax=Exiguobacterium sp. RIT594 TaxID=2282449 RepID=UPI000DF7B61F|nr:ribonuclease HIII [Exiguobacterium sp. RIT594]RDB33495.1 ribonuclease HIII [Exiguobacterium sp. RIT594]